LKRENEVLKEITANVFFFFNFISILTRNLFSQTYFHFIRNIATVIVTFVVDFYCLLLLLLQLLLLLLQNIWHFVYFKIKTLQYRKGKGKTNMNRKKNLKCGRKLPFNLKCPLRLTAPLHFLFYFFIFNI